MLPKGWFCRGTLLAATLSRLEREFDVALLPQRPITKWGAGLLDGV